MHTYTIHLTIDFTRTDEGECGSVAVLSLAWVQVNEEEAHRITQHTCEYTQSAHAMRCKQNNMAHATASVGKQARALGNDT